MYRWVELKTTGTTTPPPPAQQPRMFAIDSTTILMLTDFRLAYNGIGFLLHLDSNEWEVIKMSGAHPWLLPDTSFACAARFGKLFMYVSSTNEKAINPSTLNMMRGLPHLYALDLKTFQWTQFFPEHSTIDDPALPVGSAEREAYLANINALHITLKDKYPAATMTWVDAGGFLCFLGSGTYLMVDPVTLRYDKESQ
jgi:hypothetical protein